MSLKNYEVKASIDQVNRWVHFDIEPTPPPEVWAHVESAVRPYIGAKLTDGALKSLASIVRNICESVAPIEETPPQASQHHQHAMPFSLAEIREAARRPMLDMRGEGANPRGFVDDLEHVMMSKCPKLGCNRSYVHPFTTCDCDKRTRIDEEQRMRRSAVQARALFRDAYSPDLVAWLGGDRFVVVRDADMVIRYAPDRTREDAVSAAMTLREENKELLVENAKLRRALEKAERKAR